MPITWSQIIAGNEGGKIFFLDLFERESVGMHDQGEGQRESLTERKSSSQLPAELLKPNMGLIPGP